MSYAVENFHSTHITNGAVRWNSNGQCLPRDCVEDLVAAGLVTRNQQIITDAARETELKEFLAAYRESQRNRSAEQIAEERAEARAAMGEGVRMVNIITGETFYT